MARNHALTKKLANLYPTEDDSRRVVTEFGLDSAYIRFSDKAINNWSNILKEAHKHNKVQAIIDFAYREYPEDEELGRIAERMRDDRQLVSQLSGGENLVTRRPIVDRDDELEVFITSLTSPPQQAPSILLIRDRSGQGKTRLLELYKKHCRDHHFPVTLVNFINSSRDPLGVLRVIQTELRQQHPLPRCAAALQTIPMNMAGLSLDQQKQWWDTGAQALLEDLSELERSPQQKRFVFLFDTFEKAKSDTKTWIIDHMLGMATPDRVSCMVVVLAGREVPDPIGEWEPYCSPLVLQPLQPEDWIEYAKRVNAEIEPEKIRLYYKNKQGNPAEMANMIEGFRRGVN
jgi:hypothetical protein